MPYGLLLLLLGGSLLVGVVFYDFLRSTISLNGTGFLSHRIIYAIWVTGCSMAPWVERYVGLSLRGLFGPAILTPIAATWITLHLLGYTMIFLSGPSLMDGTTDDPATPIRTIAFVGSALSTLGASQVQVTGGWWDILSVAAAVNGMVVLTLSVSFILNVLQATVRARTFAARYNALMSRGEGRSDVEILSRAASLGPDLCDVAVRLTASPLPGVFAPNDRKMDFPAAIAELCDVFEAEGLTDRGDELDRTDVAELRWGIGLLGRSFEGGGGGDFAAARAWARRHTIPG